MGTLVKAVLLSLWLPILVLAISAARFGTDFVTSPAEGYSTMALQLGIGWLAAIPLTLALTLVKPFSGKWFGICAVILAPLSVLAFIMGGLFGWTGVVGSMVSLSLPVWVLYLVLRVKKGGGGKKKAKPSTMAKPRPSRA